LKLPESWKIHNVFHAALLRPYIENKVYGNNYPRPLPELLEGEEVYEVETILKHWKRGRGYLLREMERLSHHRSYMRKRISILQ
jgi:hypothetical protein